MRSLWSSRWIVLATALLCGACAPPGSPAPVAYREAVRSTAIAALQSPEGTLLLSDSQITAASYAINALGRQFPSMRGISSIVWGKLELSLRDSAARVFAELHPQLPRDTVLRQTGLRGIDSLNAVLGVDSVRVSHQFRMRIAPILPPTANMLALAAAYRHLPEVRFAEPPQYRALGVSGGLRIDLTAVGADLSLWSGWGDCMSGCIYHRGWQFRYDRRTGIVTLVSDSGDPTPAAGWERWLARADWAVFDTLPEERRHAYAEAVAGYRSTPHRVATALASRLGDDDHEAMRLLLRRNDISREPLLVARFAQLGSDTASAILFDRYGLSLARSSRTPECALRALVETFIHRDPPPEKLSRALVRNQRVIENQEMLLIVIREIQSESIRAEACEAYFQRYSSVALNCPDRPSPP